MAVSFVFLCCLALFSVSHAFPGNESTVGGFESTTPGIIFESTNAVNETIEFDNNTMTNGTFLNETSSTGPLETTTDEWILETVNYTIVPDTTQDVTDATTVSEVTEEPKDISAAPAQSISFGLVLALPVCLWYFLFV